MANLVTGASGFLGGRLAQMLIEQGEEVIVLARAGADLRHLPAQKFQLVRGDLANQTVLDQAAQHAHRIFHCAACSTDWAPQATYQAANVDGTANLVSAALRSPSLQRFIHVSTADIYGYPEIPCAEAHPFVDAGLPYNRTKGMAEDLVWQAINQHGLPTTIVRPATIYGPRGKDFTQEIALMLRQRLMTTIDHGTAPGGFIYVDTVAQAMIDASTSPVTLGQAYNLAEGSGATWTDYLKLFAAQLGTPVPWINLSSPTAMKLAKAFEAIHRLLHLGGRPLLTQHAVYLLSRNQEFPIAKAQADFALKLQTSLEEGIRRSVAWLNDTSAPKR
jgi:nucleoside-diphosphate-sugar epimerase